MAKTGIVVIDPGHGGKHEIGDSSANNATSASGVLEKNITLRIAFLVREHLNDFALKDGHQITVLLTREADINVSLTGRANVAKKNKADLFLSIHCNGFNGSVRGTETLIRPAASNARHADDLMYARIIQNAVFNTIQRFDTKAKDRGVKDQVLGVLNDDYLGVQTRGCLVELEFIDVKSVDFLLNIGPKSPEVRTEVAKAIAQALIDAL